MIIVFTLIILYLAYRFFINLNGKIRVLSITSFFLIWFVFYDIIGSVLLNYVEFPSEVESGFYKHPNIVFKIWLYTIIGFVCVLFGFLLSNVVLSKYFAVQNVIKKGISSPILERPYDFSKKNIHFFLFFFILSIFVFLLYRQQLGSLPIEALTRGLSAVELSLERSDATNNFSGKMYRYEIFINTIPTLLFIVLFFIKQSSKEKKWKIMFYAFFLFNIFYSLSTLQKAPIIKLLLIYYVMHVFYNQRINKKTLLILVGISVPIIILMYMFFMGQVDRGVNDILEGALHRIFIGAIAPFYWYIKYFESHDFLWGASFPNPGGFLPFTPVRLTVMMMNYGFDTGDAVGSMPTVFLGEMFANFGVIGMCIAAVFFGFLLESIDVLIMKAICKHKTIILCSLYVFFINFFSKYTGTGFSNLFVDIDIYIVVLIYMLYTTRMKHYKV